MQPHARTYASLTFDRFPGPKLSQGSKMASTSERPAGRDGAWGSRPGLWGWPPKPPRRLDWGSSSFQKA